MRNMASKNDNPVLKCVNAQTSLSKTETFQKKFFFHILLNMRDDDGVFNSTREYNIYLCNNC